MVIGCARDRMNSSIISTCCTCANFCSLYSIISPIIENFVVFAFEYQCITILKKKQRRQMKAILYIFVTIVIIYLKILITNFKKLSPRILNPKFFHLPYNKMGVMTIRKRKTVSQHTNNWISRWKLIK